MSKFVLTDYILYFVNPTDHTKAYIQRLEDRIHRLEDEKRHMVPVS